MESNDLGNVVLPLFKSRPVPAAKDTEANKTPAATTSGEWNKPVSKETQKIPSIFGSSLKTGKKFTIEFEPKVDCSAYNAQLLAEINKKRSARVTRLMGTDIRSTPLVSTHTTAQTTAGKTETLQFVNKYRPRCYADLVTNEKVNRDILQWLIQWKHHISGGVAGGEFPAPMIFICGPPGSGKTTLATVLGKQAGFNIVDISASENFDTAITNAFSFNSSIFSTKPNMVLVDEADEIPNASAALLLKLIKNTQSVHKPKQPTFSSSSSKSNDFGDDGGGGGDEEDDDDEASTHKASEEPTASHEKNKKKKKNRRKKKAMVTINKPIICTCTNLYAPALRLLRQECAVFQIGKPSQQRFTEVLRGVCKKEGLNVDGDLLMKLGQISNYDMRSVLFDLEFIKKAVGSNARRRITVDMFNKASIGEKDMETSIFDVWKNVFYDSGDVTDDPITNLNSLLQRRSSSSSSTSTTTTTIITTSSRAKTTAAKRAGAFFNTVYGSDSQDRIVEGCWLNYLGMYPGRLDFESILSCINAVCYADFVAGRAFGPSSSFASMSFTARAIGNATATAEFRLVFSRLALFSQRQHTRQFDGFAFPRVHQQMYKRRKEHLLIADSFFSGLGDECRRWTYKNTVETEFLPCVLSVAAPAVRQANPLLMSPAEKKLLGTVADAFYGLGLAYNLKAGVATSEAAKDGVNYLEPPVNALAMFGENYAVERGLLHFSLRKEVQRLVNVKKWKARQEAILALNEQNGFGKTKRKEEKKDDYDESKAKAVKEEDKDRFKADEQPPVKKRRDFFGRVVEVPQDSTKDGGNGGVVMRKFTPVSKTKLQKMVPLPPQPVKYKFHEGFTNAVRRKLKISDLL